MAGHSHSANIKYRKERVAAAKAKAFAKVSRMITVAARLGGADPDANARLRLAIEKARMVSMPKDVIERAVRKGAGGIELQDFEEFTYEGYAPCGVAVVLDILTDNRHRTAADVRHLFEKAGGNLGTSGAVAWMFARRVSIRVDKAAGIAEERLLETGIDGGAEDLVDVGDAFELRCEPSAAESLRSVLDSAGVSTGGSELAWVPKTTIRIEQIEDARRVLKCLDALEENEDVQAVASNVEFPEAVLAALMENN
ncbi:MAG: YebC/PmpR family DNA-binding transcriptional regulator [Planctomycetota bacterium]